MGKLRFLVVDDEPTNLMILSGLLKVAVKSFPQFGELEIVQATDGVVALRTYVDRIDALARSGQKVCDDTLRVRDNLKSLLATADGVVDDCESTLLAAWEELQSSGATRHRTTAG